MPLPNDQTEGLTYAFLDYALRKGMNAFGRRIEEVINSPTFAEQVAEAELLGLVVCTCLGIDHDNQRTVIIDPSCKVHNDRCETCKRTF